MQHLIKKNFCLNFLRNICNFHIFLNISGKKIDLSFGENFSAIHLTCCSSKMPSVNYCNDEMFNEAKRFILEYKTQNTN